MSVSRVTAIHATNVLALSLFGYPVVGMFVSITSIDNTLITVPFRILVGLYSIWLLLLSGPLRVTRVQQVVMLFFFLYVVRLLYDMLLNSAIDRNAELKPAYVMQIFLIATVLPAMALAKAGDCDWPRFARTSLFLASIAVLGSLASLSIGKIDLSDAQTTNGRLGTEALNPATLGHLAASALFCVAALWRSASASSRIALSLLSLLFIQCILLTGSKGPALAAVVCALLWILRAGKSWHVLPISFALSLVLLASGENPLTTRVTGSTDDPSTTDRVLLAVDSLNQIAASPWLGSAFVELKSGYYPHNIFLEAALAFGVPIAIAFTALIGFGLWRAWKSLDGDRALLGLLYLQGLFTAFTAGAIWSAQLIFLGLLLLPANSHRAVKLYKRYVEAGQSEAVGA